MKELLLIGIGNSARGDDGLGWRFAEAFAAASGESADVEFRYQLQIEDAELIAHYRKIVFVDARSGKAEEPFSLVRLEPMESTAFTSHSLAPAAVAALGETLYGAAPECLLLTISGDSFELRPELSEAAAANLNAAVDALCRGRRPPLVDAFGSPVEEN